MEGRRIFLAINLPENTRKKLAEYAIKFSDIPAKWTKEHNLHITLVFLGYILDSDIREICRKTEEVAKNHTNFELKLSNIVYGPIGKDAPRMVWAVGEKSKPLTDLQDDLQEIFFGKSINVNNKIDKYIKDIPAINNSKAIFSPHITLARLKQGLFNHLESEERPEVNEKINFTIPVESIDIMESELKKGGPVYSLLESISLSDE